MKRTTTIFMTLILIIVIQTAVFAGNVEIQNVARKIVSETIIQDLTGMGLSLTSVNENGMTFKGDANHLMAPSENKVTGTPEFQITFTLVQFNKNIKISTDIPSAVWDSYLEELKARFNGRWTFGVITDPRKGDGYDISTIILNSSAAKEGLKKGDRIIKINGSSVFDFDPDLNPYLKKAPEKSFLTLEIETGGRKKSVTLEKSFIHGNLEHLQAK